MEKYTVEQIKVIKFQDGSQSILAYLKNVKAGKLGGVRTVFTNYNGTEDEAKADVQARTEFELDPKFIVDGTPYVNKSGKTVTPKWYKVV